MVFLPGSPGPWSGSVCAVTADPLHATSFIEGWLTIGHKVRTIALCDKPSAIWLMGRSPGMSAIRNAYGCAIPNGALYQPVFAVLAGKFVAPPPHGFGADYDAAFLVTHLVRLAPGEDCTNDHQGPASATSLLQKLSFDISILDEKGLLGPPGGKRALAYELYIPDSSEARNEVAGMDPSLRCFAVSPGRIGCESQEILCIGSTHQEDFLSVLLKLAALPYVRRIQRTAFE